MDPITALGAVGAGSNLVLRLVQGGYQFANAPEDIEQLLLGLESFDETIKKTRTLRRIKSHIMDEREKVTVDRAIEISDSVLLSIRQTVESCRKDLATKDRVTTKNRLLWLLKNHDAFVARGWTVSTCMQNLSCHITSMQLLQTPTAVPQYYPASRNMLRPPTRRLEKKSSGKSLSSMRSETSDNRSILSSEWNDSTLTLTQPDGAKNETQTRGQKEAGHDKPAERKIFLAQAYTHAPCQDFKEVACSISIPVCADYMTDEHCSSTNTQDFQEVAGSIPQPIRAGYTTNAHYSLTSNEDLRLRRQPPPAISKPEIYTKTEQSQQGHHSAYSSPQVMHNVKFVELPGSEVSLTATNGTNQPSPYPYSHPQSITPVLSPVSQISTMSPPPPPYQYRTTKSPSSSISSLHDGRSESISSITSSQYAASVCSVSSTTLPRTEGLGVSPMPTTHCVDEPSVFTWSPRPKKRIKSMFIT